MALPQKLSYLLLYLFFIFDNVVSYWAVKYAGAHEANLAIAYFVEKWPLLYFVCIPLQIVGLFLIMYFIKKNLYEKFRKYFNNKSEFETVILTMFVIYWAVGNSSLNLAYLIGARKSIFNNWSVMSIVGTVLGLTYFIYQIKNNKNR